MVSTTEKPEPSYATGSAGRIAYSDSGSGAVPLVFVHGINMSSKVWDTMRSALVDRRSIALDLRGHGESDHAGPFEIDDYADDLEAVLAAADVERACLVGVSLGGMIACAFAQRAPQRVAAVVTFGSALRSTHPDLERGMKRLRSVGVSAYFATSLPHTSLSENAGTSVLDAAVTMAVAGRDEATGMVEQITRAGFATDLTGRIHPFGVPVLVVNGDQDTTCPPSAGRRLAAAVSGRFELVPRGGHVLPLELPELSTRFVADFVDSSVPGWQTVNTVSRVDRS